MVSDPVYNTQMGAAELSALLTEYKGNHIMTFAGYNAGRGRVRDWIKAYGDPRDPKVDPVDWVERIPFSETRNYVQRVMENLAVYRVRFDEHDDGGEGRRARCYAGDERGAGADGERGAISSPHRQAMCGLPNSRCAGPSADCNLMHPGVLDRRHPQSCQHRDDQQAADRGQQHPADDDARQWLLNLRTDPCRDRRRDQADTRR